MRAATGRGVSSDDIHRYRSNLRRIGASIGGRSRAIADQRLRVAGAPPQLRPPLVAQDCI